MSSAPASRPGSRASTPTDHREEGELSDSDQESVTTSIGAERSKRKTSKLVRSVSISSSDSIVVAKTSRPIPAARPSFSPIHSPEPDNPTTRPSFSPVDESPNSYAEAASRPCFARDDIMLRVSSEHETERVVTRMPSRHRSKDRRSPSSGDEQGSRLSYSRRIRIDNNTSPRRRSRESPRAYRRSRRSSPARDDYRDSTERFYGSSRSPRSRCSYEDEYRRSPELSLLTELSRLKRRSRSREFDRFRVADERSDLVLGSPRSDSSDSSPLPRSFQSVIIDEKRLRANTAGDRVLKGMSDLDRVKADRHRQLAGNFWTEKEPEELAGGRRSLSVESGGARVSWNRSSEEKSEQSLQEAPEPDPVAPAAKEKRHRSRSTSRDRERSRKKKVKKGKKSKNRKRRSHSRSRSRSRSYRRSARSRSRSPRRKSKKSKRSKRHEDSPKISIDEVAGIVRDRRKQKSRKAEEPSAVETSLPSASCSVDAPSKSTDAEDMILDSGSEPETDSSKLDVLAEKLNTATSSDEIVQSDAQKWSRIAKLKVALTDSKLRETGSLSKLLVAHGLMSPEKSLVPGLNQNLLSTPTASTSVDLTVPVRFDDHSPTGALPPLPPPATVSSPTVPPAPQVTAVSRITPPKRASSPPSSVTAILWRAEKDRRAATKEFAVTPSEFYTSRAAEEPLATDENRDVDLRTLDPYRQIDISKPEQTVMTMFNALSSGRSDAFCEIISKLQVADKERSLDFSPVVGDPGPSTSAAPPSEVAQSRQSNCIDSVLSTVNTNPQASKTLTDFFEQWASTASSALGGSTTKSHQTCQTTIARIAAIAQKHNVKLPVDVPLEPPLEDKTKSPDKKSLTEKLQEIIKAHRPLEAAKAPAPELTSIGNAEAGPIGDVGVDTSVLHDSAQNRPSLIPPASTSNGNPDSAFILRDSLSPFPSQVADVQEVITNEAGNLLQPTPDTQESTAEPPYYHRRRTRVVSLVSGTGRPKSQTPSAVASLRKFQYARGVLKRTIDRQQWLEKKRASKKRFHYGDTTPITWLKDDEEMWIAGLLREMFHEAGHEDVHCQGTVC